MSLGTSWPVRWDYEAPPAFGTLVVAPEDVELLLLAFKEHGVPVGDHRVLIASGHLTTSPQLLGVLEGRSYDRASHYDPLAETVSLLIDGFASFSVGTAEIQTAWNTARKDVTLKPFVLAIDRLLQIYEFWFLLYSDCALLDLSLPAWTDPDVWWETSSSVVKALQGWRTALSAEVKAGEALQPFLQKFDDAFVIFSNLNRHAAPYDDVFIGASVICFAASEAHLARGAGATSLMLALRSLEYLIVAVGHVAGDLRITRNRILRGSQEFKASNLIIDYRDSGQLAKATATLMLDVNSARNQLTFTHGFGGISTQAVRETLKTLEDSLSKVGSFGWLTKLRKVRASLPDPRGAIAAALSYPSLVKVIDSASLRAQVATA